MMTKTDERKSSVTGVVPSQFSEAIIRETWPGVTDVPVLPMIARLMARSVIFGPLAFVPLALCYGRKITPFLAKRYTLTNRRLMIQHGLKPSPSKEAALQEIDEVRHHPDTYDDYFKTGDLDIIVKGQVVMRLEAVPEPEAFRRSIQNALLSWGRKKDA